MTPSKNNELLHHRLHRYGLNPCGEIIGTDFFCNLAEVHLNLIDPFDIQAQRDAFRVAALLALPLLTHEFNIEKFKFSREVDPIIGVSFTGLFDFFVNLWGAEWLSWWVNYDRREDCDVLSLSNYGQLPEGEKAPFEKLEQLPEFREECFNFNEGVGIYREFEETHSEWVHPEGLPAYKIFPDCDGLFLKRVEQIYFNIWKDEVRKTVEEYCSRRGLVMPNRYTTIQPAGTKSLLTGASPGWHPPKAQRFIRRITFAKDDPVAKACIRYGYSVIPSQSDKDENGVLLNDPYDPRCTEWLVEIPVETSWANMPGVSGFDISQISAKAQFDFYMNVQEHYVTHNASATIEFREHEIDEITDLIYEAITQGKPYISATLLARFDNLATFPRLPFEPIDKVTFDKLTQDVLDRQESSDFYALLKEEEADSGFSEFEGPMACDSDKCLL